MVKPPSGEPDNDEFKIEKSAVTDSKDDNLTERFSMSIGSMTSQESDYSDHVVIDIPSEDAEDDDSCRRAEPSVTQVNRTGLVPNIYKWNEYIFVVVAGTFLSFNTGYINGACLTGLLSDDGRRQPTAAFTSTYTLAALYGADGEMDELGFQVCITLSFMFGSYIAGLMNPDPVPYQLQPMYGPTFLVGAIFLFVASVQAALGGGDYFFYFAAAAAGVQNGISSLYSANLVRSTGLTGTTTDVGIIVGQLCRGNTESLWKLVVLLALSVAFTLGGLVSYYATRQYGSHSLLFNAGMFLAIGLSLMVFLKHQLKVSFSAALFGTWKWKRAFDQLRSSRLLNLGGEDADDNDGKFSMIDLFDKVDVDGSGDIDLAELTVALSVVGIPKSDAAIIMRVVDVNGDGVISREEWTDACSKLKLG